MIKIIQLTQNGWVYFDSDLCVKTVHPLMLIIVNTQRLEQNLSQAVQDILVEEHIPSLQASTLLIKDVKPSAIPRKLFTNRPNFCLYHCSRRWFRILN